MRVPCFAAVLSAVFLCATSDAKNDDVIYEVTGVPQGDVLIVRSGAGASFDSVAQLVNGDGDIKIIGGPVMNGRDDWVHISFAAGAGWVRPKFLRLAQTPSTSLPATAVEALDDTAKTAGINPTERTIEVWRNYSQIREDARNRAGPQGAEPEPVLFALEKLDYAGADSVVVQQIQDTIACLRAIVASNRNARAVIASQLPKRQLLEALRPKSRELGERLMPDTGAPEEMRREAGKALGELMLMYAFSSPSNPKEKENYFVRLRILDRLLMQESLTNRALGLEDSESLRKLLSHVRDRACAARLLEGKWESREVNGRAASLEFSTDPKSFAIASGHLEMVRDSGRRSRNPGLGDVDHFDWQFIEGVFYMAEIGWGQIGGLPKVWRTFRAVFTSPGVFEISDEKGVPVGTWRRRN